MSCNKVFSTLAGLLLLFIVLCSFSSSQAAVFTQRAIFNPAHPGKCFDKFTRRAMLPNKEYKPKGICAALTCDLESQTINIETCPYVEMPGCEELPADPAWSFPKCCPQFKCTDFKTGKEFVVSL
ncbi:uncharacterized protein [Musca autumnalis]|uniref:uncharacterized protein n=1 Tax=Musca autumnalis TaxID=221902 RepID=UPI003CE9C848